MRVLVGTSGFSYPAWKGRFYPADLPAREMLPYYAGRFDTVEANATFYRMPRPETLAGWRAQVPASFTFSVKAPQRITHALRLRGAEDAVARLTAALAELGPALGAVLFGLPPSQRRDLPRLRDFLASLPRGRHAFEFRHASWFDDAVFAALAEHGAALCVAESDELATPLVSTAPFGYLRLRRTDYGAPALRAWARAIAAQPWQEAFVYLKHEDTARGPAYAAALRAALAEGEVPAAPGAGAPP